MPSILTPRQPDASVRSSQVDQRTAGADNCIDAVLRDFAAKLHLIVGVDTAVAGAGYDTGVHCLGQTHRDAAVRGTGANILAVVGRKTQVDMTVRGLDSYGAVAACDVRRDRAVRTGGVERTAQVLGMDAAVRSVSRNVAV